MKRTVLGMIAHVDAGKTTLCEAILFKSGAIRRAGRVDKKDAFLDNFANERARGKLPTDALRAEPALLLAHRILTRRRASTGELSDA